MPEPGETVVVTGTLHILWKEPRHPVIRIRDVECRATKENFKPCRQLHGMQVTAKIRWATATRHDILEITEWHNPHSQPTPRLPYQRRDAT